MSYYFFLTIKRYIEQCIMFPFILIGHIIGMFQKAEHYDIYFFIPIYGVGGAEYVNAKILEAIRQDKKIKLIFTKKSWESTAYHLFEHKNISISDVSRFTDNKFLYFLNITFRGIFATAILKQKVKPIVFIGQCNFGYKLTPHLYRKCKIVELIHVFDKQFANVWLPFVSFLDIRIGISYNVIELLKNFKKSSGVPYKYNQFEKLNLFVDIPAQFVKQQRNDNILKVYFAGRNAPEKRVYLLYEIARRIKKLNLPVAFTFVGNLESSIPEDGASFANFPGTISAGNEMYEFVTQNDVVLLTSRKEGLPIMILEAIYLGLVPVTTPEADIPIYINNSNGYLLKSDSEEEIIRSGVDAIKELALNANLYQQKASQAKATYNNNFSKKIFDNKIIELLS